jgi:hypothetical protein
MNKNIIAFGRSSYLFNSIKYLSGKGYQIKAIITDESYKEYNVLVDDFHALSQEIGSAFFLSKMILRIFSLIGVPPGSRVNRASIPLDKRNVRINSSCVDLPAPSGPSIVINSPLFILFPRLLLTLDLR